MEQRAQFVFNVRTGSMSVAEACRAAGISRKTGYKWLQRYDAEDLASLGDASRAPRRQPHRTDSATESYIVELRKRWPTWGARKLRAWLIDQHPGRTWPASSTVHDILVRHGLVDPRPRRSRSRAPATEPLAHADEPNAVWSIDFKGQFHLGNGRYCYPLTITDNFSRMLLGCYALEGTHLQPAMEAVRRTFDTWGLPRVIRSDNGTPFSSHGVCGLTRLSAWWWQLGITHERIEPGKPQQNGRHERMHLTLKIETTRPAAHDSVGQQQRFDDFVDVYNHLRPHEALGQTPPARSYEPSPILLPQDEPRFTYEHCDMRKRVSNKGNIKLAYGRLYVSEALAGQYVGLTELEDGVWRVTFGPLTLGLFEVGDNRLSTIATGTPSRRNRV